MGLFPLSQPIFLNDTLLKQCVIQVMKREEEIQDWRAGKLSLIETFPGSFERCRPIGMGRQCPYLEACWNSSVGADPLGSGLYARRKPHHELELINLEDDHDEAD
jgi:hypothetical protein